MLLHPHHPERIARFAVLACALLLIIGCNIACGSTNEKKTMKQSKEQLIRRSIDLAVENVKNGGGPFGAVIVRNGEVIAEGANRVTANHDPTAHAEVQAIRAAAEKLGTFDLAGCDIYASCEPCPMCLGAIYWAHLDNLYYAATKQDAAQAGFDDAFIYEELDRPIQQRRLHTEPLTDGQHEAPFTLWAEKSDKVEY